MHQILSFERIHDEAITAKVREVNSQLLDRMRILIEFGPEFLRPSERERRLKEQLSGYFDVLAVGCFNFRDREFWRIHKEGLDELGYSIYNLSFAKAIVGKFLDLDVEPEGNDREHRQAREEQKARRTSWLTTVGSFFVAQTYFPAIDGAAVSDPTPRRAVCG